MRTDEPPARGARLRHGLQGLWLGAVVAPAALAVVQGLGRTTLVAAGAWALAGAMLVLALARDPDGRALVALRTSRADILLAVAASLLLVIGVLLLPLALVVCGAILAFLAAVSLWALVGPSMRAARFLRWIATGALAAVLLGIATEIVLRLPAVVAITGGHRPGIVRWEQEHYDRLWEHNALGLRSLHLEGPTPVGTQRILALGDDATFGALIARTADTWPYFLEEDLVKEGRAVEIINAGQRGFTTANEAEWLQRVGSRFEPDLLIVQFGLNDAVPSYPDYRAERSFWYFRLRPLLPGLDPYLSPRSYLYSALDSFKEHQEMRHLHPEGFLPLYEEGFEGWKQARDALHAMAAWADARGIRTLLVLFPDFEPDTVLTQVGYRYLPAHEKVQRAAEAEGIDVLDLLPVFTAWGRPPEAWWPLPCEPLPGPEAQRVAASAIREEIDRKGLLRRRAPVAGVP